jgi:hypothetical protein
MTMTSTRSWIAATLTAAALGFGGASASLAQDKPKDDELGKLLEKLDGKDNDKNQDKPTAESTKDKAPTPDKPKEAGPDKPKESTPAKAKSSEPVAPKDQELDKLLEGLGQTKDTPAPEDKKPGGGSDDPMPPKADQPKPDELKGGEKDLDKELERITGKKEKPKDKKDRKGEEDGPLGKVIKEMREVEERLGKPDTGEETRKKQTEIVKNLDDLIERMKNAPSQKDGMRMIREGSKPGQQPGNQPGNQPGATADGAPQTKPTDPKKPPVAMGLDKDIWGTLPRSLREQMGNVMNEHPLPTRTELIKLYYKSLGQKSTNREE